MCLSDIYYLFKHWRNRKICPRCGNTAFEHGWFPDETYYCSECHLWEKKDLGGVDVAQWSCEKGHIFMWIRRGEKTRPDKCPECGSNILEVREV